MKILVISSRDLEKGSTKFRIVQYQDYLATQGVEIDYIRRKELKASVIDDFARYDVIYNQKCLISIGLSKRIFRRARRVIFDFDDAIYTRPGKPYGWLTAMRVHRRLHFWLRQSNSVMTANQYLAKYAKVYSEHVEMIPMAIDMQRWEPDEARTSKGITLGWAGSPVNIPNLERLDPVLSRVLEMHPNVRLAVYSGKRPQLSCRFDYVPFAPGTEAAFIQQLDIGLLPLRDEEYSRGKSPIKAIQYLACGVPVVGNIFGATAEILDTSNSVAVYSDEEWLSALSGLVSDRDLLWQMSRASRKGVVRQHDVLAVREQLLRVLQG